MALASVAQQDAMGDAVRLSVPERIEVDRSHLLPVVRVNPGKECVIGDNRSVGLKVEETKHLRGPGKLARREIQLPVADVRDALCFTQASLACAQGKVESDAFRDVDNGSDDADGLSRGALAFEEGLRAGVQPANGPVPRANDAELSAVSAVAARVARAMERILEQPPVFGMNRIREDG